MKTTAIAATLLLCLSVIAASASTITATKAVESAEHLITRVGAYSARHADDPGAFAPWADDPPTAGTPILIHAYPSLEPSYFYVPLVSLRTGRVTFVTIGAADGRWQAFGERTHRAAFPMTTRADAADRASRLLGQDIAPGDLRAVSMPNKHIYWHWSDPAAGREIFIGLSDPADVHTTLDSEIAPREEPLAPPLEAGDQSTDAMAARDARFPSSYDIDVPHHYQATSYNCGPAASEMVMDYYGPDIDQSDIVNVANCTQSGGTYATDVRRSGHFSNISSAFQNPVLQGYDERSLGYGALTAWWSNPDTTDVDYPGRYNDLKDIISQDFPVLVLTWYDTSHGSGHFRVVKGYNDSTNVFIVHDPWYDPPYEGPDVHFNQTTFVDDLWRRWFRWGTLICPWEVDVIAPTDVYQGQTFTVQAAFYYHGPHPFENQDLASSREATIFPTSLFSLAPGESLTQALPGSLGSGPVGNLVTWDLVAGPHELGQIISVRVRGLITDSSQSYASYSDSIGGWGSQGVTIWDPGNIIVDVGGSGLFLTIQEGVDAVDPEGTVHVRPGTYSGTGNVDLHFDGKEVTLVADAGPESTIIDCEGTARGFVIEDAETPSTVIDGFTITGGINPGGPWPGDFGGGMLIQGASPTIRDCVIESNYCYYLGGGIACIEGASPVIEDCRIIGNSTDVDGGGGMMCYDGASPSLTRVRFEGNVAGWYGGGLWCDLNSHATVTECTFTGNMAFSDAGAIAISDSSNVAVDHCTLFDNESPGAGGIFCGEGSPEVTNTIIAFGTNGQAVTCMTGSTPSFTNCCVYGNALGDSLCGSYLGQDNLYLDPRFCEDTGEAIYLQDDSPCAGAGTGGSDIGAFPVGCPGGDPTGVEIALPGALALHLPRPSPFSGATTLALDVPADAGRVTLAVYNIHGQLVRMLADGAVRAGTRRFVWTGKNDAGQPVAAGVYFARCESEKETSTTKMVLME